MKCPKCHAKLLPVDGEMFCLQCGTAVAMRAGHETDAPDLEETTDPLLQRAITEVVKKPVHFQLPVSEAPPAEPKITSFSSMRSILAPPRAVLTSGGAAVAAGGPTVARPSPKQVEPNETAPVSKPVKEAKLKRPLWGGLHAPSLAWMAGIAAFGLFVLVNGTIMGYYSSRVYPGVKVAQTDLSGVPLSLLHQRLESIAPAAKLTVEVGGAKYALDMSEAGKPDVDRAEREIRAIGHNTPLPLAGAVQALLSKPVTMKAEINDEVAGALAGQLAARLNHKASDALPLVVNGQAFVISEKAGSRVDVDKLAAEIKSVYGSKDTVKLTPEKLTPLVTISAYVDDVQEAQARMALNLQVKVRSATHSVSAAQIGSWLVFNGPGKGVSVDGTSVSAYVATLPGTFDRRSTTTALIAAAQNKQSLSYVTPTKRTSAPKLASTMPALPMRTFSYCVAADSEADVQSLRERATVVLSGATGWSVGGRLKYAEAQSDCNFTVSVMAADKLTQLNPGCAGHTTCRVDNTLALSAESWGKAPDAWKNGLDAYRAEMVGHEVGHWLGFDHAACTTKDAAPVLSAPALIIAGCSSNWYAVPIEMQASKVLDGF